MLHLESDEHERLQPMISSDPWHRQECPLPRQLSGAFPLRHGGNCGFFLKQICEFQAVLPWITTAATSSVSLKRLDDMWAMAAIANALTDLRSVEKGHHGTPCHVRHELQRWVASSGNDGRSTRVCELRKKLNGLPIHILAPARWLFFLFLKKKAK